MRKFWPNGTGQRAAGRCLVFLNQPAFRLRVVGVVHRAELLSGMAGARVCRRGVRRASGPGFPVGFWRGVTLADEHLTDRRREGRMGVPEGKENRRLHSPWAIR